MQYHAGTPVMAVRSSSRPRRPIKRYGNQVPSGCDKKPRRTSPCTPAAEEYTALRNLLNSGKCARRTTDFHEKVVQETQARIKKAEQQKTASVKKELNEESQAMQLKLSKEQVAEYRRLKAEVEKRCTILSTDLDNKLREQEAANNAIDYDKRRLHHSDARLQQMKAELDRERRNLEALRERKSEQMRLLGEERKNLKDLQNEVTKSMESKRHLKEDLQHVCTEIADAHGDNLDPERNQRQHEAVENLKRVFPEKVFGRLVDLCQPSQKRYQIAVTKILGNHMMSIVCDNEETGRECIAYLREQHYPPETILPLAELCMEQIKEHLRDIREPPGVMLGFDVINVPGGNAQNVRKALQFVCGNSLVCETPDHARQLAYGTDGRTERYRAVALDGTQFLPNGVISGGIANLKAKAKKWDENTIRKLKDRRSVLQEDLQKLHRTGKRELDVEMKHSQIRSLEARLRFAQQELKKGENETLRRLEEQDIAVETAEPETIKSRIENRQIEIEERKIAIERLKQQKNAFADEIFAQFCAKIGISHIREYEQREIRIHEEHEHRLNQYNSGSLDQNMLDAEVTNSHTVDDSQPGPSSQSHCETTQFQTRSLEAAEQIEIDYSDIKRETQYEEEQKAVEQRKHGNLKEEGELEEEGEDEREEQEEDGNLEDEEEEEDEGERENNNLGEEEQEEKGEDEEEKEDNNLGEEEQEEKGEDEEEKEDNNLGEEEQEEKGGDEEEKEDNNLGEEEQEEKGEDEEEKEDNNLGEEEQEEKGGDEEEKEDNNLGEEEQEEKGGDEEEKEDNNLGEEEQEEKGGDEEACVVERILEKRLDENGEAEYLVKWQGRSDKMNSWEPIDVIKHFDVFKQFESAAANTEKDGVNQNNSNASPPSLLLTLTLSIDLFERRRFINGNTKALCKLCGDSMGVDLQTLIRHIVSDKNPHHQLYALKILEKQLELGFPIKSSETPPSFVLIGVDILQFVRAIWAIDLFERRQFIDGRTKALCKLCGDSLLVDLEALIRHIATNEDPHHLKYAVKLLEKQLESAITQPPAGQSASVPTMQIFVRLLTGSIITLEVEAGNTVADVKEMVEAKEGISQFDQQLIFAGKRLEESRTLADCNVQKGSTFDLVLCVRGE